MSYCELGVAWVGGWLIDPFLDGVGDEGGDGFLPLVEVNEAAVLFGWVGGLGREAAGG